MDSPPDFRRAAGPLRPPRLRQPATAAPAHSPVGCQDCRGGRHGLPVWFPHGLELTLDRQRCPRRAALFGQTRRPRSGRSPQTGGEAGCGSQRGSGGRPPPAPGHPRGRRTPAAGLTGTYPGDFRGRAAVRYAPAPNGLPEPGEIVWTWVPYEEDYSQGKDRPVLLVGTSGKYLLGLMLTSKDHDGDSRRADDYVDIGTGPWDRQWRPSEAKLDRVLQINAKDIRREGAILDAGRFDTSPRPCGSATAGADRPRARRAPDSPHSSPPAPSLLLLTAVCPCRSTARLVGRHRYPHAAQSMANLKAL